MTEAQIAKNKKSIGKVDHDLLGCYANVWIRQKHFQVVGEEIGGHTHKYDHVSLLAKGKVRIRVEQEDGTDKIKEFEAPTFLVIKADRVHNVTALTDDVLWYCVFANRDINGEVYDAEKNCPVDSQCHGFPDIETITIHEEGCDGGCQ